MTGLLLPLRGKILSLRLFRRVFLLASLAALVWPACAAAAAPAFPLHTSGQYIVDSNGMRVHLNAFNWYGFESTDYVVEGLQAQPLNSIVSTIKGLGFNTVRLLWSNQMVESNPVVGNYALTANPSLESENALTIMDTVVNALTSAGIMVILDNHMSNAGWCCSTTDNNELWYNSQYPQANWVADWQTLATRYKNNPGVIGVDLRNEPRSPATWGGSSSTDWHAAAELGGNAVLTINPNLLVFVEGVNYAGDLSGVATLPVQLNVANQLVYEAHDYGFWYSTSTMTSYSTYVNTITPKWGYLVTGSNPQPLWVGEFGTCNSAATCATSNNATDLGFWFSMITSYLQQNNLDWSYWAINGTTESGNGGGFGTVEGYGVLNLTWNGGALAALTSRLQSMMAPASANFSMIPVGTALSISPGNSGSTTVTIVPENGFTGTVNLSCAVVAPSGSIDTPTCSVPPTETISGNAQTNLMVTVNTTGMVRNTRPSWPFRRALSASGGIAVAGALLFLGNLRRGRRILLVVLAVLATSLSISACGGGGAGGNGGGASGSSGTSAGNYVVTVTGTASGLSAVTAQISVVIQ